MNNLVEEDTYIWVIVLFVLLPLFVWHDSLVNASNKRNEEKDESRIATEQSVKSIL